MNKFNDMIISVIVRVMNNELSFILFYIYLNI